jgi:DNA-binding NarL/FixJ family response regulator
MAGGARMEEAKRSDALDFTPMLAQVQANNQLTGDLLGDARVVICLGSRAQISFLVGHRGNDGKIIGAATTESEGLELAERLQPDFLFTSDELEEGCGLALVLKVKRRLQDIRTLLMIRGVPSRPGIQSAIHAGCDGILLESRMGMGTGLEAIRTVCGGGIYLDRGLAPALSLAGGAQGTTARRAPPNLSPRELDVLARLVGGESNATIAQHLIVSVDTVKTHLRNVQLKLQARDRTHAAVLALQFGLIDWPEPAADR